jgi:hypothetical protein
MKLFFLFQLFFTDVKLKLKKIIDRVEKRLFNGGIPTENRDS